MNWIKKILWPDRQGGYNILEPDNNPQLNSLDTTTEMALRIIVDKGSGLKFLMNDSNKKLIINVKPIKPKIKVYPLIEIPAKSFQCLGCDFDLSQIYLSFEDVQKEN